MDIKKLVFLFYMLYTVYSILMCGTTDLQIIYLFPALLLLWICYFTLSLSLGHGENIEFESDNKSTSISCFGIYISNLKAIYLFLIGIISLMISFLCAKFYTGLTPAQVFDNLRSNNSNYISYQIYFQNSNIGVFSIQKIPYIILMGLNNIFYVYSLIIISVQKTKIRFVQIIYLLMICVSHLYFGVARGTNYEAYQLFLILCFCYNARLKVQHKKFKIGIPLVLGFILVVIFFSVLSSRGMDASYNIAEHIHYDENEIFSQLFPTISKYYVSLYSYLGFGIYYIATMINGVWFNSYIDMARGVIPFFNYSFSETSVDITNRLVVIGVKWVPDAASIMNVVGVFGLIIVYYAIGKMLKQLYLNRSMDIELSVISSYIIFVFCVTIASGHFITFSSEQILIAYTIYKIVLNQIKSRSLK